ncbi:MAG: hypothetical protein ACHQ1D_01360 [Nitrososphaerales archaeon]
MMDIRFKYGGVMRQVSNFTNEGETFIGLEIRKAGKFSFKIKRYTIAEVEGEFRYVKPYLRTGPKLGLPA